MQPLKASWELVAFVASLLGMSLTCAAQAELVLFSTEGLAAIDMAQRDSAGMLRLFAAEDENADGMISFVADLDLLHDLSLRIYSGTSRGQYPEYHRVWEDGALNLLPGMTEAFPFLITGTEERVLTKWNSLPAMPFTIGQPFSVVGGQILGIDAVVYRIPFIESIVDVVDLDLSTLPVYAGPMRVGGLVRFQAVPEPSTLALAALGTVGLLIAAHRKR